MVIQCFVVWVWTVGVVADRRGFNYRGYSRVVPLPARSWTRERLLHSRTLDSNHTTKRTEELDQVNVMLGWVRWVRRVRHAGLLWWLFSVEMKAWKLMSTRRKIFLKKLKIWVTKLNICLFVYVLINILLKIP